MKNARGVSLFVRPFVTYIASMSWLWRAVRSLGKVFTDSNRFTEQVCDQIVLCIATSPRTGAASAGHDQTRIRTGAPFARKGAVVRVGCEVLSTWCAQALALKSQAQRAFSATDAQSGLPQADALQSKGDRQPVLSPEVRAGAPTVHVVSLVTDA